MVIAIVGTLAVIFILSVMLLIISAIRLVQVNKLIKKTKAELESENRTFYA